MRERCGKEDGRSNVEVESGKEKEGVAELGRDRG